MKVNDDEMKEILKDGQLQRQKIDENVEKLLDAAQKGDIEQVSKLLKEKESDKNFVNETDANARTALHFACHGNHLDIVKLLLKHAADIDAPDWDGYTPLMYALKVGHADIAKYLVEQGANVNVCTKRGITPLHTAVMSGSLELVKYLSEKGATFMPDKKSEAGSVLHFACTDENTDLVSFLIEREPQLVNSSDENLMTPLHFVCAYNNTNVALYLIEKGAYVNAVAQGGTTPLHIAADSGNKKIVESLISHGAIQRMDQTGHTPHMLASKAKHHVIEDLLKDLKVDLEHSYKDEGGASHGDAAPLSERISPEKLKENGNKAFAEKDYEMAVHWYTLAIDVDSVLSETFHRPGNSTHVLYSNRSTAYYHLKKYKEALEDAEHVVQLAPNWPKGYLRKGASLAALGRQQESEVVFNKMKELEEKEKQLK